MSGVEREIPSNVTRLMYPILPNGSMDIGPNHTTYPSHLGAPAAVAINNMHVDRHIARERQAASSTH